MRTAQKRTDRRNKARFPFKRELRYKLLEQDTIVASGMGETLDMSSSGVAFESKQPLKEGSFIELSISWPVLLDESCPMRLIIFGRIVRSSQDKTVCTVDKYEFRTQSRTLQTAAPVRTDSMLQRWADGYRRESLKTREASV
jgi:hypothetical protein